MDGSTILNIILGVLEAPLIAGCLFYFFFRTAPTIHCKRICYVAAYVLDVFIIVLGSYVLGNDIYTYIGHGIAAGVIGYFLFEKSKVRVFCSLFYVTGTLFLMAVVVNGFLVWLQYQQFMVDMVMAANVAIALKIVVILLFTKVCVLLVNGFHGETVTRKMFFSLFIPFGISSLIYISIQYMSQIYTQLYGFGLVQLNLIFLIGLNLYFLYLLSYLSKSAKAKSELELLQRQSDTQYRYYETLEEKYQESRKIIHDMRNHLLALEQLYQADEREAANKYASDMHQMMNHLGQNYYTDNRMLNIILNDKVQRAVRQRIAVDIKIGDVDLSGIKDVDITTIFGNLLDNAIEAAAPKEGDEKEAGIQIKADYFHEFIVFRIQNTISGHDYGKEKGHKGLGLTNVRKTLEAYHGGMQIEEKKEAFGVSITIPKEE